MIYFRNKDFNVLSKPLEPTQGSLDRFVGYTQPLCCGRRTLNLGAELGERPERAVQDVDLLLGGESGTRPKQGFHSVRSRVVKLIMVENIQSLTQSQTS